MKKLPTYKDFTISPLTGGLDTRSPSGEVSFTDFRLVLNMDVTETRKRCRMGGWKKLLADSPFGFKNQDFHDQLEDCQVYYESITQSVFYDGSAYSGACAYPFFYPEQNIPDVTVQTESTEIYYGLPTDYYPYYAYNGELNQNFICDIYDDPYNVNDYFHICYTKFTPGYTVAGYSAGDCIPSYDQSYYQDYDYCGGYPYRHPACREAITLLFEAVSVAGKRKLVAGTKSKISVMNDRSGNWRIIADGLGGPYSEDDNCTCSARRFRTAQIGNILIFTNDFDPVMTWEIDSGPNTQDCNIWSAEYIPDLLGLGINKARVVAAWRGFVFLGNVEVDNERHVDRIYWSDFNDPRSWAPGGTSAAGYVELGSGEEVIAMEPIGGQLRVYTRRGDIKGIYEVSLVGGDEIFNFHEIYRGPDGLEYENTLVNTGHSHLWLSTAGIVFLGEYDRSPQRLEWTYKADGSIYHGIQSSWVKSFDGLAPFGSINKAACHNAVGGYNSELKQVWFSWPTDEHECANMSLVLNAVYQTASLVDHGFTAFRVYRPDYTMALRDFLAQYGGCDPSTLIMPKEGEPIATSATSMPLYIRNATEDPNLPVDPDSICARLTGTTLDELCESCGVDSIFVMASASDKTLKEFTPSTYYRERYVDEGVVYDCPKTTPGDYVSDGYYSLLQGDAYDYKQKPEKLINQSEVDFIAEAQTTPNDLYFHAAYGAQAECMRWDTTAKTRPLECITEKSDAQHAASNTRAAELASYKFYRRGSYLAWRMFIRGTGGGSCFDGVVLSVRPVQGEWK